ncbi:2-oxoglutarate dehydrogenase E2 component (dihydrolipoamide succinyltransferase) [Pedobacter westerhofensis]|uniref:Dihydrolipoamide acetyltransferase component of pyruvate dehydrogenase complex n=1 Tax=Pedobacter westerhofensis TaxID=425512 RepID=A0A521FTQ4_9SPHI|nr:dihydrolipoamide acetyltransferase family protein [Pedobacter westerhofensis]SMO99474.1 2-oxoglutarate dehydrogenase E2 component (dihydrolipoamide succinyltransferase) [Pedobacter westerhofensis]
MAQYELLLPKMGESVAEATVIKWLKQPGDMISLDDTLLEIATDKVDSEVPSPVSGKLISQLCKEDDVVQVGAVIALIETDEAEAKPAVEESKPAALADSQPTVIAERQAPAAEENHSPAAESEYKPADEYSSGSSDAAQIPGLEHLPETVTPSGLSQNLSTDRFYSPLVKNIAAQEQISTEELDLITGTGADGRLTKDDLLHYLQNGRKDVPRAANTSADTTASAAGSSPSAQPSAQPAAVQPAAPNVNQLPAANGSAAPVAAVAKSQPAASMSGSDEIIEMDRMGKLISDHMVMSKQTSAHVTSFVEADVTNMVMWREKVKKNFEKRENEKITFTPIFLEAVAKAIRDFPMINVSVQGTKIIKKKDINIGMAAALPSGNLIVPVIKNADQLNLVGLTKAVNDLAVRARGSKLKPDETQGGTFTLTNVGSFGNVMGTPIINQPQVAILAVGAIKKKPAVLETEFGDVIAIRHMMFLSLSYDHRVVNGALGGMFVRKVADYLEDWDINRDI